jgi:nucleotide-binding universal stress UspA family protein
VIASLGGRSITPQPEVNPRDDSWRGVRLKLAERALGVDQVLEEIARETLDRGVALAREAGLIPEGQLIRGKPWSAICAAASEVDAEAIVLGARGLSRMQSVLLGSVSFAVLTHAKRPVLVIPHVDPPTG